MSNFSDRAAKKKNATCYLKLSANIQTENKALFGGVKKSMFLFMEAEILCEMDHESLATIAKLGLSSMLPTTETSFNRGVICVSSGNLMKKC